MNGRAILAVVRRLGFVAVLLAALSTANAEVREFSAPAAPMDAQFVYAPEQEMRDSWLALVLRKTGMDIWVLLMRDLLLMDDVDYSRAAAPGPALAGPTPAEAPNSPKGGCDEPTPSAQATCELERDRGDAGLTSPAVNSSAGLADMASDANLPAALGGGSFGGFTWFAFRAGASGAAGDAGQSSESEFDQPTGDDLFGAADVTAAFSPAATLAPASVPEIPTPLMLLFGAGALALAAKALGVRAFASS